MSTRNRGIKVKRRQVSPWCIFVAWFGVVFWFGWWAASEHYALEVVETIEPKSLAELMPARDCPQGMAGWADCMLGRAP